MTEIKQKKTITFMRHAEAGSHLVDRERPLTDQGLWTLENKAHKISQELKNQKLWDLVLVSDAVRTRQSFKHLKSALTKLEAPLKLEKVEIREELYSIDREGMLCVLEEIDDAVNSILWVGHNPLLTNMATEWSGKRVALSPGDLVHLEITMDSPFNWKDFSSSQKEMQVEASPISKKNVEWESLLL